MLDKLIEDQEAKVLELTETLKNEKKKLRKLKAVAELSNPKGI